MSRYQHSDFAYMHRLAHELVADIQGAMLRAELPAEAELYLATAKTTLGQLAGAIDDVQPHVICPLCEGEDVAVDGRPDLCPACQGDRTVTEERAARIREALAQGGNQWLTE